MPGQPLYPVTSPPPPAVRPRTSPGPVVAPPQDGGHGCISTVVIVLLIIGGVILGGLLVLFVIFLLKRWRAQRQPPPREQRQALPTEQRQALPPPEQRQALPPPEQRQSSPPEQRQPPPLEQPQLRTQPLPPPRALQATSSDEIVLAIRDSAQADAGDHEIQEVKRDELQVLGEGDRLPDGLQIIKNCDLEEIRELGSGTFGTVYLGRWRGTEVAIKRIHTFFVGKHMSKRDEFWNEVGRLASLHHPNVVAFYGAVIDGPAGSIATVTEYVADGSLRQALQVNKGLFDKRRRLLVAMDIAICMEYLHEKKIVHFDLKSDNLLVNLRDPQRPVCKVCDLGLSKEKTRTFLSGGMRGTLPWMAPELLGSAPVSEKVDVYSFGIVMWELLTGKEPYAGLHEGAIIGGIAGNALRPEVPKGCELWWRSLMEQCWSNEPSDRPAFTEIAKRLRTIASSPVMP